MSTSLIDRFDMSREHVETLLGDALRGADDGELYLEYREQESLVFDNGRLKACLLYTSPSPRDRG